MFCRFCGTLLGEGSLCRFCNMDCALASQSAEHDDAVTAILKEKGLEPGLQVKLKFTYFVTFTCPVTDPRELLDRVRNVCSSKRIHQYKFVFELTDAGLPHIHAIFKCGTYLKKRDVQGLFGNDWHIDIKPVPTPSDKLRVLEYMDKVLSPENADKKVILEKYLLEYKLERTYAAAKKV